MSGLVFDAGDVVTVHCTAPKEKLWGVLIRLDGVGVVVRGLDLDSVEDWLRQQASGGEQLVAPSTVFLPMHRIQRIYRDESNPLIPSYSDRYAEACQGNVGQALLGPLAEPGDSEVQ
jgi:hypothetical protein